MKRFYLFMLMFIAGIGVASADVDVRLNSGDNSDDQANVKCIAFTMPTEDVDGNPYTQAPLHNINLFIKTGGGTTSYMVISSTRNDLSGKVAVSTNKPAPNNAFAEYTFSGEMLQSGQTYYMMFASDAEGTTQVVQRPAIASTGGTGQDVIDANGDIHINWIVYYKLNYQKPVISEDDQYKQFFSTTYGEKWVRIANCSNSNYVMTVKDNAIGTATKDAGNAGQLFCFVGSQADGFKIYSAEKGSGYALKTANTNQGTAPSWGSAADGSTWYIDTRHANASSQPGIGLTTDDVTTDADRTSLNMWGGAGGDAKFYPNGAGNGGSRWTLQLMNTLTIEPSVAGIKGIYSWNGLERFGANVMFASDASVGSKAITASVPGFSSAPSQTTWDGASTVTVTNTLTPDFFNASTDNIEHWVRITNVRNPDYAIYANNESALHSHVAAGTNDELFALIGTASSFKIYSKTEAKFYGSANNNQNTPVNDAQETSYTLVAKGGTYPGYAIVPVDNNNQSLNMHGGKGNDIKYYAASDDGSTWMLTEVGGELTVTINLAGDVLPINSKVGTLCVSYNGESTNTRINLDGTTKAGVLGTVKLTAPKGSRITLSEGQSFSGYTFSATYNGTTGSSVTIDNIPNEGTSASVTFTANDKQNLFYTVDHGRPYRIPAIAKAQDGTLIAVTDDRFCGSDIGYGKVNLVYKVSKDNGQTWGEEKMLAEGDGNNSSNTCGFGDAAICADRTSDRVMVMAVSAPNGGTCWTASQRGVITWGTPNGEGGYDWTTPVDIKQELMDLLPNDRINYFVGSGKISQSRIVRKGQYYRVYVALWTTNGSSGDGLTNYVVYSDDFGAQGSWRLLGENTVRPVPGGDEPKAEELPDGSVVVSGRKSFGRYYNIFTFTDEEKTTGRWSTAVASHSVSNGLSWGANSTNGEIMVVKATRKSTGEKVDIVMQSAPAGAGRSNVTIWYKVIDAQSKYADPTSFSQNWTKGLEVSAYNSAYSTMCVQADGRIAFFFEDSKSGAGYDMVYQPIALDQLNGLSDYTIDADQACPAVELNGEGFATYSSAIDVDITTSGVAAYKASINGEKLTLSAINGAIPAGTGVVLYGEGMADKNVEFTPASSKAGYVSDNQLQPTTTVANYIVAKPAKATLWALGEGSDFLSFIGDKFVANRAYFDYELPSDVKSLHLVFDTATGICQTPSADAKAMEGKYVENRRIVILKGGKKYNSVGMQIK